MGGVGRRRTVGARAINSTPSAIIAVARITNDVATTAVVRVSEGPGTSTAKARATRGPILSSKNGVDHAGGEQSDGVIQESPPTQNGPVVVGSAVGFRHEF